MPLPADTPVGSVTVYGHALAGTFCASPFARGAVRPRAQSSRSVPVPPAASPVVRRRGNPSSAPAARDWIAPVPDAALLTSGQHLPASGRSASSTVPVLPKPVSNIAPWTPSLLPRPPARRTIPIAIADGPGWCQTGASQTGTRFRLRRRPQPRPTSSCERQFPLFCKP